MPLLEYSTEYVSNRTMLFDEVFFGIISTLFMSMLMMVVFMAFSTMQEIRDFSDPRTAVDALEERINALKAKGP